MSFLKYSNCWSKEKINLSEDILELINNSSLNLFDVSEVLRQAEIRKMLKIKENLTKLLKVGG